ncbi:hypothetical protein REPUB_Repub03eG0162800 [Reevesia pubescens]
MVSIAWTSHSLTTIHSSSSLWFRLRCLKPEIKKWQIQKCKFDPHGIKNLELDIKNLERDLQVKSNDKDLLKKIMGKNVSYGLPIAPMSAFGSKSLGLNGCMKVIETQNTFNLSERVKTRLLVLIFLAKH